MVTQAHFAVNRKGGGGVGGGESLDEDLKKILENDSVCT